ncbi:MAG: cryptochrome/photolyase family protein, partial [Luminiphilus sp.]
MNSKNGILILGDQLSWRHPLLLDAAPADTVIILAEVAEEATYVRHNRHKIALIFSAMRHFAQALEARGFTVQYSRLKDNVPSLLAACE